MAHWRSRGGSEWVSLVFTGMSDGLERGEAAEPGQGIEPGREAPEESGVFHAVPAPPGSIRAA